MTLNELFPMGPSMNFASSPGVTGDGGGGGAAPPAGGGAGGAGQGTTTPGTATPAPGQGTQPNENIRQLREQYEGIKSKYGEYEKLGDLQTVSRSHAIYQNLYSQVAELGTELGYPEDQIIEALEADPVKTLDYLRQQMAGEQTGRGEGDEELDLDELVSGMVEKGLAPVHERENIAATNNANALMERTCHSLISDYAKKEGVAGKLPQEEANLLLDATKELMKYDREALVALKNNGDVRGVQKYFTEAQNILDKYYTARFGRETSRVNPGTRGGGGKAPGSNGAPKVTIDDLIDDPSKINAKYR